MRAIITVIGTDTMGIIAKVSGFLADNHINILDISQTIMQDLFTMIMLVDLEKSDMKFDDITENLDKIATEIGVNIRIQHEDIFNSMHRI
jgi:ACT domain-containing protein